MPNINPFIALLKGNTSSEILELLEQYSDSLLDAEITFEESSGEEFYSLNDPSQTAQSLSEIRNSIKELISFVEVCHE